MRVLVLGDIHGRTRWASHAADIAVREGIDTIIQVGDLGVWPGGEARSLWNGLDKRLSRLGVTMLVAPGNHEDYDQIDALVPRDDGWLPFRNHVLLAPRGHRTTLGGRSVLWLGGAGSVDRSPRIASDTWANERYKRYGSSKRQHSWWPQEEISTGDVEHSIEGGHADIMVCHDAPYPVQRIEYRIRGDGGFRRDDLEYSKVSRGRLTEVVTAVKPDLLMHGHFHFPVDDIFKQPFVDHAVRVFGLAAEGAHGSLAVLDLDTLAVEHPPVVGRQPS